MNVLSPHIALYRLFDLADEIDLARLGTPRLRVVPLRSQAVETLFAFEVVRTLP
jgi:hypothetical protein